MPQLGATPLSGPAPRVSHSARCGWFWAWVAVGALGAIGLVSLGPVALAPALTAGVLMARMPAAREAVSGLLTGAGFPLLLVAYVQRDGPGTTCFQTATSAGCDQHLNPLPWLVLGLVFVAAGFAAQMMRHNA
jgi:hypothetical protein